jgi:hypothetical protein
MKGSVHWRLDKAKVRVRRKADRPSPVIDKRHDEQHDEQGDKA